MCRIIGASPCEDTSCSLSRFDRYAPRTIIVSSCVHITSFVMVTVIAISAFSSLAVTSRGNYPCPNTVNMSSCFNTNGFLFSASATSRGSTSILSARRRSIDYLLTKIVTILFYYISVIIPARTFIYSLTCFFARW